MLYLDNCHVCSWTLIIHSKCFLVRLYGRLAFHSENSNQLHNHMSYDLSEMLVGINYGDIQMVVATRTIVLIDDNSVHKYQMGTPLPYCSIGATFVSSALENRIPATRTSLSKKEVPLLIRSLLIPFQVLFGRFHGTMTLMA
jgi:hypothetical protein